MQKKIARKIASITAVSLASGLITVPAGANADLTPNLQIMQKTEIISDEALDQSYHMIINQMGTIKNLRRSKRRGITLSWLRN